MQWFLPISLKYSCMPPTSLIWFRSRSASSSVSASLMTSCDTPAGNRSWPRLLYEAIVHLAGGTHTPSIPCDGDYFYILMQTLPEKYSNTSIFPTGCSISFGSLSCIYGSRSYPAPEYVSSDYIFSYTNSLLLHKYPYRKQLLLFRRGTSYSVHHKHMDILYAGCSLLHWYLHWWKIRCLFYTVLGAPSSPKKYGLSYRLFYRQEWHLSPTGLLLMYNFLPGVQQVSLLLQRYTGEYLKTGKTGWRQSSGYSVFQCRYSVSGLHYVRQR